VRKAVAVQFVVEVGVSIEVHDFQIGKFRGKNLDDRVSDGVVAAQHKKSRILAQVLCHAPLNGGKCLRRAGGKLQAAGVANLAL
jgi:hypothetical protein